jgi:HEAT repeat protein
VILAVARPGAAQDPEPPDYAKKSLAEWMKALGAGPDPELRQQARRALGPKGPYAAAAVPALIACFNNQTDPAFSEAVDTLADYGPGVVPTLLVALKSPVASVREGATWSLGAIGPQSADATRALLSALDDPAPDVRVAACWGLGGFGRAASGAIPHLCTAIRDGDPRVRAAAAGALQDMTFQMGSKLDGLTPVLTAALRDEDAEVREHAAMALWHIGPAAKAAVPELIRALGKNNRRAHWACMRALGSMGPSASAAVPVLVELLQGPDSDLYEAAASALGNIGPEARAAVPALLKTASEQGRQVRFAAIVALGRIGPASREAVPIMIKGLGARAVLSDAMDSARALGGIGPDARAAVPALAAIARDRTQDSQFRKAAAFAVAAIDPGFAAKNGMSTAYLNVRLGKVPTVPLAPRKALGGEQKNLIKSLIARLARVRHGEFGVTAELKSPPLQQRKYPGPPLLRDLTPDSAATLRDLIRIGPDALPYLLEALDDASPSKLTVPRPGGVVSLWYSAELPGNYLNPEENRALSRDWDARAASFGEFLEPHPATVGDLCFAVIGEIVGREYQGPVVALIDSPGDGKHAREQLRAIWSGGDPRKKLLESLLLDYATEGIFNGQNLNGWTDGSDFQADAAARLLYYYPDETAPLFAARLRTLDVGRAKSSRDWMRRDVRNGVEARDFIRAVAWSAAPPIKEALDELLKRTDDPYIAKALRPGGK